MPLYIYHLLRHYAGRHWRHAQQAIGDFAMTAAYSRRCLGRYFSRLPFRRYHRRFSDATVASYEYRHASRLTLLGHQPAISAQ